MANEVTYKTKEACIDAINTLKAVGIDPLPWQLSQLKAFEEAEAAKASAINSDTPIWSTLQANYPYGVMPQEKIDCVEGAVSKLMESGPHAEEPGLLLGKIQCGKTDTFEDIIGLAFDKGIDIAVVLTKGTKALVNQTIKRMKHDYRFFRRTDDLSQRTIIDIHDIMSIWRSIKQAQVNSGKTVIVCKKNATNLDHLMEMFQKNAYLKKKKVLVVDDEADFASRNYRTVKLEALTDEEGNPALQTHETEMAKIAQQIDDFRKIPEFCRYLQVTATPYCLYLQPQGELNLNGNVVKPFKPRFTSIVPTHDRYIGGQQYYVESQDQESMYSHLYHQVEQKCIDVLGHEDKRYLNNSVSSNNIYGLTYSVVAYFLATGIRRIQMREAENKDYKTTAVIHVEIDKKNHDWQRRVVERLIDSIKAVIVDEDQTDQRVWFAIDNVYQDFEESNRKGRNKGLISVALPPKKAVLDEVREIFKTKNYHVQVVNSDAQMETLLNEETGELELHTAANIFIGGNILDRGVTIQHMLCFFYGRNPKGFQQDTVLQHARMYGARSKEDMAVMRLHTTPQIYKVLVRMNELDDQLRKWIEEGRDQELPNAVFVGYDKNIKPCATQKIKVSNTLTLKPQQRVLPVGFWTGNKSAISKTVSKIEEIIVGSPHYQEQDENGFFEMSKEQVVEILQLIESTYVYDKEPHFNIDRKNDIKEMLCALEYCSSKSDGKVYALHRTNRNMNRVRANGGWIDAPDDGRTDTAPSRDKAIDSPVVMFLQQNGNKAKDENGENIGWNNAPFYWPVLMTQAHIDTVMYALDQTPKGQAAVEDMASFFEGYNKEDILTLTYKGDLEEHFGKPGTVYEDGQEELESRTIKQSTATKFILKDEKGNWALNPDVPFDEEHDNGVYSRNNGIFPFVLRPYKYMCLRNRRDAKGDLMLLELTDPKEWEVIEEANFDNDGNLIDRDTLDILVRSSDQLLSKDMTATDFRDDTITQWLILYKMKGVLKLKKAIDWDKLFSEAETDVDDN